MLNLNNFLTNFFFSNDSQLNSPLSIYEKSFFNELANNLSANNLNQNKTIEKASVKIICANLPKEDYGRVALISVHGDPGKYRL